MNDPFDLQRFVDAQNANQTYDQAMKELISGRKRSHWMWFVFPQVAGLGFSAMSQRYAISGIQEARAYLNHPVLGPRLREGAQALLSGSTQDAVSVFGSIDAQKLQSSMTLFARAAPNDSVFRQVLDRYFDGDEDSGTIGRLA